MAKSSRSPVLSLGPPRTGGIPTSGPFTLQPGFFARKTAAFSLLLALLVSVLGGAAWSQQRGLLPGEEIILGECLRFSVMAMRDRDGVLDHFDWVTVRVENNCPESRRFLVVELVVIDPVGRTYGGKLWVLGRGELLRPGGAKTEHYALPDPDNRKPHRWMARLVYVQKPGAVRKPTRRKPTARKSAARKRSARKLSALEIKARQIESRLRTRRKR